MIKMKHIYFLLLFSVLVIVSCEDKNFESNNDPYVYCDTIEPFVGYVQIKLTVNQENQKIPLIIYRGEIDDNDVVYIDTISVSYYEIELPVDEYYSAKAEYHSGDKTIYAIDGDKLSKSYNVIGDSTCWTIKKAKLDLNLNY
jgi:hypothetical protein